MTAREWLTVVEAATKAKVAQTTMIEWCRRYKLGRKVGGRWRVDEEALDGFLGEWEKGSE